MKTNRQVTGTIYVFDGANVLQGWVGIEQGWWRFTHMNPAIPRGPRHASRMDALENAAETVDTLWPPVPVDNQSHDAIG